MKARKFCECQVEGSGWDSGMGGIFDAAGICLFPARVFFLLLPPLTPDCLAGCGDCMRGVGSGTGASDGFDAPFSGGFAALEVGV